ncbi:hypothetical protein JZU46_01425, partial [bacterium]|nr:hypothetical protein [bacterium]
FGKAKLDLFDFVKLDGALDFQLSETEGLTVFADVSADIGVGAFSMTSAATGLLVIGERNGKAGAALRLQLEQSLDLGPVAKLDAKLDLTLNTFEQDIIYVVPETFQEILDPAKFDDPATPEVVEWEYVISATPTGKPDWTGMYVQLLGEGSLDLLSGALTLQGDFGIILSESGMELGINATLDLPLLNPLDATGTLGIVKGGVYGSLQVGSPGQKLLDVAGVFSIEASVLLQINTTTEKQTVKTLKLDANKEIMRDANGKALVEDSELEATSLYMRGTGVIDLVGIELSGAMALKIDSQGLQAALDMKLDLGAFGELKFEGAAAIMDQGDGAFFALRASTSLELGIAAIGIHAAATLEINTGSADYTPLLGGEAIKGDTKFKLDMEGGIKILAFDIGFKGGMSLIDDVFEIRLDKAELDFFGVLKVNISGYLQSDGDFEIKGSVDLKVDMEILVLKAGMSMTFSNKLFAASVYGSLDVHLDLGFFEINTTLAGFSGEIILTPASATLNASVTVAGISVAAGYKWSWGADPVISSRVGDTLYLHMGDTPNRYGSDIYDEVTHETYNIQALQNTTTGAYTGEIKVSSLGMSDKYTGIKKIVARGGKGNDTIFVSEGVDAVLDFEGGAGSDNLIILGGAMGSVIRGGDGNDVLMGGDASGIVFDGGAGNDKFTGGAGSNALDMGIGKNDIVAGSGDNT